MFSNSATIIRILAFIAFTCSVFSIGWDIASNYNKSVAEEQTRLSAVASGNPTFGIYGGWGDDRRLKRLVLVPFSLVAFLCIRRFPYLSLSLYGFSIGIFLVWFVEVAGNPFDYALFGAVLILFPSLIRKLLLGKYQGKN